MTASPPTAENQVLFLRNVQRLLGEGLTSASYKFALLHAIADLCVVQGDDSGAALDLDVNDIAEKFVELYWQQCRPFQPAGRSTGIILQQNAKPQAEVITRIIEAQRNFSGPLFKLKHEAPKRWRSLTKSVMRVVNEMPLWKLQNVGNERITFLYDNLDFPTTTVTLKPGVTFCFRAFYGLLRDLIQGAWVRFVQKLNATDLGNVTDLGMFLFDQERSSLEPYQRILLDLQERKCFYCQRDLRDSIEVDHFIPWSRYPTDLGHNFVLAHARCNNSKSDNLAGEPHLQSWARRNQSCSKELAERLRDANLAHDIAASRRITEWAYEQLENANGQVWLTGSKIRAFGAGMESAFGGLNPPNVAAAKVLDQEQLTQ